MRKALSEEHRSILWNQLDSDGTAVSASEEIDDILPELDEMMPEMAQQAGVTEG